MTYQCPNCGSTNCEERDRCITCLDCSTQFKVWMVKCSTQFKVWMVKEGRKPMLPKPNNNYVEKADID